MTKPSHEDDLERGFVRQHHPTEVQEYVDPFDIDDTKKADIQSLQRWRQEALVLNASRRFRYTLDLNKKDEKEQRRRMIRAHAQVIRAVLLFKLAGQRAIVLGTSAKPAVCENHDGDFGIGLEELVSMNREHDLTALQQCGGVKGIADMLETNLETGCTGEEGDIAKRKSAFGSNTYPMKPGKSYFRFLWESWQDLTLIILIICAVSSLSLGIYIEGIEHGWYDGGSIFLAVLIVILVTSISDYRQSLQFQSLNDEKRNIQLEVLRDGRRETISIYDIIVGDVVPLKIGDQVPADGIFIAGHHLSIDESSMTGESKMVNKSQKAPFLMSGCKVHDGAATMLVTGVGINTEWGLLMASILEDTGEETPLQVRLNGLATFIGLFGVSVAVVVLTTLWARYFSGNTRDPDGTVQFVAGQTEASKAAQGAIKNFAIAVTIVVVAVPEGLPLAVTLTLAYSMRKMMMDKALVRRLSACETMGSSTTICSDKTGTLTLNQMTVVEAYVGKKKIDPPEDISQLDKTVTSLITEGIAQNTTGSIYPKKNGEGLEISGSPTEKAILQWGVQLGMDFNHLRSESVMVNACPFNSEKKLGGVAVKMSDSQVLIHWKGAAELIVACCSQYLDSNGSLHPMEADKALFEEAINNMAEKSLRCVAIAYRRYEDEVPTDEEQLDKWEIPDDNLVLLAIVGIKDPCRPNVPEAVRLCGEAGVKVRMVTGDNIQTAKAIARECGILPADAIAMEPIVIEGKSFREKSEKERQRIAPEILVMGRSSPNDKLLLVQALRALGHVVAVTGDGTNDAPALHEADIGLSMGIAGTEVAKESSDIVILDDNFATVVKVVRWGRSVYANIQKFIQFQLTVNVAALTINVVAAFSQGTVPLNAVQLLWVNIIMDTLGALALATEAPTDSLMKRTPVGRREPLITNIMWRNLFVQVVYLLLLGLILVAIFQIIVLLTLNFRGKEILDLKHTNPKELEYAEKVKNTVIFNAFVFCQIFNEVNARKPETFNIFKGIHKNHFFLVIISFEVILQVIIIFFLGFFFKVERLTWQLWLLCIIIAVISWPLAVVGKCIPVSKVPLGKVVLGPYRRIMAGRRARAARRCSSGMSEKSEKSVK